MKEMNNSLSDNVRVYEEQSVKTKSLIEKLQDETKTKVEDLEGQVRDLMFYLDTQRKVEVSGRKEEILSGDLILTASPTTPKSALELAKERRDKLKAKKKK